MSTVEAAGKTIRSTIPARLDRLSWSPFHTRMVAGLGAAWILDGLQITIASSVTGVLVQPDTLDMSSSEVGMIASIYLVGQVVGALYFGRKSDQLGRKRLLIITLLLYLFGTGLAAFTVNDGGWVWLAWFYGTRFIAGMGIGGQYAAINSAIDEMMPSKYRGRVDIWINGSYWAGAILGSFASLDLPERVRPQRRLAARVPAGPRARDRRDHRRAHAPREPALADDPRPHGGGREEHREDRGGGTKVGPGGRARRRLAGARAHSREAVRLRHVPGPRLPHVPEAGGARRDADDHPVVPLQRDLLHLRAGARQVLRRERRQGAAVRACLRGRQPVRAAHPRAALRQRRPQADDLGHVHHLGRPARDQRLDVRQGPPRRDDADVLLDRDLLLRLRRGERRLPHGQRDVADRDPRRGDRGLLRHRADLRSVRPRLLRLADRRRLRSDRAVHRLRDRGSDHGHRRDRRARDRDQGGGEVARGHHETDHGDRQAPVAVPEPA